MIFCCKCTATAEIYTSGHTLSLNDALPSSTREPTETTESRIGRADGALYRAKGRGRNCVASAEIDLRGLRHAGQPTGSSWPQKAKRPPGDRKSTRLNSSQQCASRMPSSA